MTILDGLGLPSGDWLDRAEAPEVKARLRATTGEAIARGLFGAPSFTFGPATATELFWGNDRLETALAWARGTAAPPGL